MKIGIAAPDKEVCLTQRAPDGWESARFQTGFWLKFGPGKAAFSPPAHPRVTLTVGWLDKADSVCT
jgi:hypothetical protein